MAPATVSVYDRQTGELLRQLEVERIDPDPDLLYQFLEPGDRDVHVHIEYQP